MSIVTAQQPAAHPHSLLAQARELLDHGYVVAAAVTARSALEAHVLALFEAHELAPRNSKAGVRVRGRVQLLRTAGILGRVETGCCHRVLASGNAAAHGREVSAEDVGIAVEALGVVVGYRGLAADVA